MRLTAVLLVALRGVGLQPAERPAAAALAITAATDDRDPAARHHGWSERLFTRFGDESRQVGDTPAWRDVRVHPEDRSGMGTKQCDVPDDPRRGWPVAYREGRKPAACSGVVEAVRQSGTCWLSLGHPQPEVACG